MEGICRSEVRRIRELFLHAGDKYFYIALENNLKWLAVSLAFPVVLGFLIAYAMRARMSIPYASANGIFFSGDDVARRVG